MGRAKSEYWEESWESALGEMDSTIVYMHCIPHNFLVLCPRENI